MADGDADFIRNGGFPFRLLYIFLCMLFRRLMHALGGEAMYYTLESYSDARMMMILDAL